MPLVLPGQAPARARAGTREGEEEPEIVWRSFQLQPDAPRFGEPGAGAPTAEHLGARGFSPAQVEEMDARLTELVAAEGLDYRLDRAHHVNSFEAHRRIQTPTRRGMAGALVERLVRAQLVEGLRIDDPDDDYLIALAHSQGAALTPATATSWS